MPLSKYSILIHYNSIDSKPTYTLSGLGNSLHKQDRLDHTSWCSCAKCSSLPRVVKCFCCKEIETVCKRSEGSESACITKVEQFEVVCLDKDLLYTAHTVRGDYDVFEYY